LLALSRKTAGKTVTVYHAPSSLRALSDLYGLQTLFWVV
jgi:ABC-type transporter Mla MlaB component